MNQALYKISEIELVYKPKYKAIHRPKLSYAHEVHRLLIQYWCPDRIELIEEFKIILLNSRNSVLGIVNVAMGGLSNVMADPKIIFASALKSGASKIILAHNHPSMDLNPSKEDIALTEQLKRGAFLLGLEIVDHLIVNSEGFYSFKNNGM